MRALSIRQPFAEAILAGRKRVEFRSRPTRVRGRVYVYASNTAHSRAGLSLPRGVIVGTVEIYDCARGTETYEWHLRKPKRLSRPRRPRQKPQPVWFFPFGR